MHIFRHARELHRPLELWRRAADAHDSFDLLLALAQLECAVSDCAASWAEGRQGLLGLSQKAAAAFLGLGPRPGHDDLAAARQWLPPEAAPLYLGAWEGLRYYALWPAAYAESARDWMAASGGRQPVWVLGLRSMGSILAPVAAAALAEDGCEVQMSTLRPTGHPFDRRLCPEERLQAAWRRFKGAFLIVDEGPGLFVTSAADCGAVCYATAMRRRGPSTSAASSCSTAWTVAAPSPNSQVLAATAAPRWSGRGAWPRPVSARLRSPTQMRTSPLAGSSTAVSTPRRSPPDLMRPGA